MLLFLKCLTDASRERILADPKEISLCFDQSSENTPERDPHFDEPECDLDKSWDILCFLFCGETFTGGGAGDKSFPSNFLFMGAKGAGTPNEISADDFYYGPPWIYSSQKVKEIADFLDTQTAEQLRTKFTPEAIREAEAYPNHGDVCEDDQSPEWEEEWTWIFGCFTELKKFVHKTANRNLALLLYLS